MSLRHAAQCYKRVLNRHVHHVHLDLIPRSRYGALLTVLQVLTGEKWPEIMYTALDETNSFTVSSRVLQRCVSLHCRVECRRRFRLLKAESAHRFPAFELGRIFRRPAGTGQLHAAESVRRTAYRCLRS